MKVKSVVVELEPESPEESAHATHFKYENNMWTANGPTFTRIMYVLGELIRNIKGNSK